MDPHAEPTPLLDTSLKDGCSHLGDAAYSADTQGRHRLVAEIARLRLELEAARATIDQMEEALESSRDIGAAIGIIMFQRRVSRDDAFELLRVASQDSHRKLRDIAVDVVYSGSLDDARDGQSPA